MRYLIPIAANEDLFPRSEFHFPKPLVEISGKAMIARVIEGIETQDSNASFIFVVRKIDCDEFSLDKTISLSARGKVTIVALPTATRGSLCSCLMAVEHIDDDAPIVVCNGDQVLDADLFGAYRTFSQADAGVITFNSVHPRWSYVRTENDGSVIEAAEKRVLSRRAIAGFYYYRRGRDFIAAAQSSIMNSATYDGPFYLSPTLNEIILKGGAVKFHDIPETKYHSLYSPSRVEAYERLLESRVADVKLPAVVQFVIPMAGLGSRFSKAGYQKPKPFIDVIGQPMISRVIDNLYLPNSKFVLIARGEHLAAEPDIAAEIEKRGDIKFMAIERLTEGATCTVLSARKALDSDQPVVVANCDQIVDFDCTAFVEDALDRDLDGSILVFKDSSLNPKWSFAKIDEQGFVTQVKEKVAISDLATVGIYYFRSAQAFYNAAMDMISANDRVNNEFYVCPLYNYMIAEDKKVGIYEIEGSAMHGIGTPDDLQIYVKLIS